MLLHNINESIEGDKVFCGEVLVFIGGWPIMYRIQCSSWRYFLLVWFKYLEIGWNHYTYRHAVDDHKNLRKSPISIGNTWATSYCPNCVFSFLIWMTEVDILLATNNIYGHEPMETLEFWNNLVKESMNNT